MLPNLWVFKTLLTSAPTFFNGLLEGSLKDLLQFKGGKLYRIGFHAARAGGFLNQIRKVSGSDPVAAQ